MAASVGSRWKDGQCSRTPPVVSDSPQTEIAISSQNYDLPIQLHSTSSLASFITEKARLVAEQAKAANAQPWTWWRAAQLLRQTYQDSEAKRRLGTAGLFRWCAHELEFTLTQLESPSVKGVS